MSLVNAILAELLREIISLEVEVVAHLGPSVFDQHVVKLAEALPVYQRSQTGAHFWIQSEAHGVSMRLEAGERNRCGEELSITEGYFLAYNTA